MQAPLSLRPQIWSRESNPAIERATGLPRRSAPRNGEFLRAFAPSREPNLILLSREGARARKKLEFVIASFLLTIGCSSGQKSQQSAETQATGIVAREQRTSPAAGCYDNAVASSKNCIAKELAKQEAQLNATLRAIRDQGVYPFDDVLNTQKAWRAYADLECRQGAKLGFEPRDPSYCLVDMLAERNAKLSGDVID